MTDPDLVARLADVLMGPLASVYPLLPEENEQEWKDQALDALFELGGSDVLDSFDRDGRAVTDHLDLLATGQIQETLTESPGRSRLLGELIRNVANPGRINQGLKGTCSVTCIETWLAETQPTEYIRIIAGLCSPAGRVALKGGAELVRDEDQVLWFRREGRRSPVSRLFQVACMEFAYPNLDYCNTEDAQFQEKDGPDPGARFGAGIDLDAFDRLLEGITGERWDTLSDKQHHIALLLQKMGLDTSKAPDILRDGPAIIRASLAANEPVFVTLDSPFSKDDPSIPEEDRAFFKLPHKVRLLRIDEDRILYEDPLDPPEPWIPGVQTRVLDRQGHCLIAMADFKTLLVEMNYKPAFFVPPA